MHASLTADLVGRLADLLQGHGMKVVTAESCTGGGIAREFTSVPGSSNWFERGFVTYSDDAKREMLGVPADLLQRHGAVSEETAAVMAEGALLNSHGDISVSVTGIAGPDGGADDKPVGLVCFGWAQRGAETLTTHVIFEGDRHAIREQSVAMAIQGLIDLLESRQE